MLSLNDIKRFFHGNISLGEPVAKYSPLRVGGPADYVLHAKSPHEVEALQKFFRKNAFPHVVLHPETIVSDKGFRGAVILGESTGKDRQQSVQILKSTPPATAEALIKQAGISGLFLGGAEITANRIVNTGNATSEDVRALVLHACRIIEERCNVRPEIDLQFVGFDSDPLAQVA